MKTKTLLVTLIVTGLFVLPSASTAATVSTDKADYASEEPVVIEGTGFCPGPVSLNITGPNGSWDIPVAASEEGFFSCTFTEPKEDGGQYTVTALDGALPVYAYFTDSNPVHNVNFATSGLPSGVSIVISWNKTNPAGQPNKSGTTNLTSPGPSADEGTQPGTTFTYSGFPASVTVGTDTYNLESTSPASGFTTGAAGESTTVTATYEIEEEDPTDNEPPEITINVPADGAEYSLNQVVLADWAVTDNISAPENITINYASAANGAPIDTSSVGTKTFTVTATDEAGNEATESVTYYVRYVFGGFLPPITANGIGLFKLGSNVAVKFQLFDASGAAVGSATATITLQYLSDGTPSGAAVDGTCSGSANTGNQFRYDAVAEQYIFNLATKALSIGTWEIQVDLGDGSAPKTVTIGLK